jgi:serine/threonine-protein kinase
MRICPVCGKLNPEESRNCDVCGAPLNMVTAVADPLPVTGPAPSNMSGPICPVCRRGNRSASVFCAYCGYRLKPAGGDGASLYALPKLGAAHASVAPPTVPIPADVSGNIPSGVLLKRRYRILRKIAQGGMGAVYEASDPAHNGVHWAVKEMSPASLPQSERTQAISDFRREAQILATLKHPNLPEVVETFEEMGKYFLVMEFIAGRTLLNVVDTYVGFIPEERVMAWARQMFNVLHYLHSQDPPIIYRDVKPANIMLVESTERIKLIDFGIARFHKAGKVQDTEAFGTAGYAPPEQYGKGQTDQRSDVYALGATLHHIVTKQDPSLNPFNWVPARRLNPHISPSLENALMVATTLDPAKRFQSIEEFGQALGILLPGAVPQPRHVPDQPRPVPPVAPVTQAPAAPVAQTVVAAAAAQAMQGIAQSILERIATPPTPAPATASRSRSQSKKKQTPVEPQKPVAAVSAAPAAATPAPAAKSSAKPGKAAAPPKEAPIPITSAAMQAPPDMLLPTGTGSVAIPVAAAAAAPAVAMPMPTPKKQESQPVSKPNLVPLAMPVGIGSSRLFVSDPVLDLGEARWNTKPARKVSLSSPGGAMKGMVLATQPWIAYNPQHFQGSAITLDVKVKKSQLRFSRVQLQVPNLFAIIWSRTRKILPILAFWFWLLVLVGSSFGRMLLLGLAGTVGALILFEALMWLWAQHVRLMVPAERLNTGRIVVKSSGGDQQIDVKVLARPSWLQRAAGWSAALILFVAEVALATWALLSIAGITIPLPTLW